MTVEHNCRQPKGLCIGDRWACECGKVWMADKDGSARINEDGSPWLR